MRWRDLFVEGVEKALSNHNSHTVVVHHEWQEKEGENILHDIAERMGSIPLSVQLIVIPDSVRDIYPVGFLDPPTDLWQ